MAQYINKQGHVQETNEVATPQSLSSAGYKPVGSSADFTTPANIVPTPAIETPKTPETPVKRYTGSNQPTESAQTVLSGVDTEAIRQQKIKDAQAQLDTIEADYTQQFKAEAVAGEGRQGQTRAVSARSGILGQDFGEQQKGKTTAFNNQQVEAIQNRKSQEVANVWNRIYDRTETAIKDAKNEALLTYQDREAKRKENATQTIADLKIIAESGQSLDTLSQEDYNKAVEAAGYADNPDLFELAYNSLKPKASQIDWKTNTVGNTLVYSGIDPITGELKTKTYELPDQAEKLQIIDGVPYNVYTNEDGSKRLEEAQGVKEKEEELKPITYKGVTKWYNKQGLEVNPKTGDPVVGNNTSTSTTSKSSSIADVYKFTASNKNNLIGSGFNLDDISVVEKSIANGATIDQFIQENDTELSDTQKTSLKKIFGGKSSDTSDNKDTSNNTEDDILDALFKKIYSQ